jgi:hypothetical protein
LKFTNWLFATWIILCSFELYAVFLDPIFYLGFAFFTFLGLILSPPIGLSAAHFAPKRISGVPVKWKWVTCIGFPIFIAAYSRYQLTPPSVLSLRKKFDMKTRNVDFENKNANLESVLDGMTFQEIYISKVENGKRGTFYREWSVDFSRYAVYERGYVFLDQRPAKVVSDFDIELKNTHYQMEYIPLKENWYIFRNYTPPPAF